MAGEEDRIGSRAISELGADDARIVVSAVTVWEIAIKRRLGKLDAPPDLLQLLERSQVELLPINARHGDRVGTLPMHHRDPFDRLLIAQAELEDFALVTADAAIADYGVDVIW
jgi:PIN domain nuclease of toxin-antitoxin system